MEGGELILVLIALNFSMTVSRTRCIMVLKQCHVILLYVISDCDRIVATIELPLMGDDELLRIVLTVSFVRLETEPRDLARFRHSYISLHYLVSIGNATVHVTS